MALVTRKLSEGTLTSGRNRQSYGDDQVITIATFLESLEHVISSR